MISSGIAEGEWGTGTLSSGRLRICSKDTRICSDSSTLRCSGGSSSQNRLWALAEEELVGKPFCVYYIPTPCFITHYKAGEELRHMHNFSVSRHRPKGDTYVVPCVENPDVSRLQAESAFMPWVFTEGLMCASHCTGHRF